VFGEVKETTTFLESEVATRMLGKREKIKRCAGTRHQCKSEVNEEEGAEELGTLE
jgi:hypothetical protein